MIVVDEAVFTALEAAGFYVPALHTEDEGHVPPTDGRAVIHDGIMLTQPTEGAVVVEYDLPYAVFYSSVGDDDNARLSGRRGRRSVFFSITYVGGDRQQAKWLGERIRDEALGGRRIAVPGHRTWLCAIEESQRVRRDDDAIRPDGSPLFYGVDEYALSITRTPV